MSYTMVRRLGRREAFGDAASDAQQMLQYGRTVASISSTIGADDRLRGAMSPTSYAVFSTVGTATGALVQKIAGGEDPGLAIAEQIAFIIADIVIGIIKDIVKDIVSIVPVLGPIVNIIIDGVAGAAKMAAASAMQPGRTGDQNEDTQRASDCLPTTVNPKGYLGVIRPCDILSSHSGPGNNQMPDLGQAIYNILNPTPSDLDAVRWASHCWQNGCNRDPDGGYVRPRLLGMVGDWPRSAWAGTNQSRAAAHEAVIGNAIECTTLKTFYGRPWDESGRNQAQYNAWTPGFAILMKQIGLPALAPEALSVGCISYRVGVAADGQLIATPPPALPPDQVAKGLALGRSGAPAKWAIPATDLAVMRQMFDAIASQYMLENSSGGVELWGALLDLLVHQIVSGNINDNGIAVILSRHSPAGYCFDFNPSMIRGFYALIDDWYSRAHPVYKDQKLAAAKQIESSRQVITDWVNKNVDVSQRQATLVSMGVVPKPTMQINLGAVGKEIVACVKAKGTWSSKGCTTTRQGVVWSKPQLAFVAQPLLVVKKSSPMLPILFVLAAVGSIAWMAKHQKKRATA